MSIKSKFSIKTKSLPINDPFTPKNKSFIARLKNINTKKVVSEDIVKKYSLKRKLKDSYSLNIIKKFTDKYKLIKPFTFSKDKEVVVIVSYVFNKYPEETATKILTSFTEILNATSSKPSLRRKFNNSENNNLNLVFLKVVSDLIIEQNKIKDLTYFKNNFDSLKKSLGENNPNFVILKRFVKDINVYLYNYL